jgi:magnesium transporter
MMPLTGARLDRLERSSATLRESVMQPREAYQSQVDNDANQMMKLFAVVSSIFLPLTFLTGWYGMNFRHMPELYWKYVYPSLFLAVLAIVSGIVIVFRRKKFL